MGEIEVARNREATMAKAPNETVLAWIDAVNAGDTERALELTTPEVAIVGVSGATSYAS